MTSHGDRGSGTVLVLGLAAVVLAAGLAALMVAASARAAHLAATAADLGALAGADALVRGVPSPCDRARSVVTANSGRCASCRTMGDDSVQVVVEVDPAIHLVGISAPARAVARAGPAPDETLSPDASP